MRQTSFEVGPVAVCIPGGLLKKTTLAVYVANFSKQPFTLKAGQLLARGDKCVANTPDEIVSMKVDVSSKFSSSLKDVKLGNINHDEKAKLMILLNSMINCFSAGPFDLGSAKVDGMQIITKTDNPIYYKPYRISHKEREAVRSKIDNMLKAGIIRHSNSDYASPIVLVRKKTGDLRICVDYRGLNSVTIKDRYPLASYR